MNYCNSDIMTSCFGAALQVTAVDSVLATCRFLYYNLLFNHFTFFFRGEVWGAEGGRNFKPWFGIPDSVFFLFFFLWVGGGGGGGGLGGLGGVGGEMGDVETQTGETRT